MDEAPTGALRCGMQVTLYRLVWMAVLLVLGTTASAQKIAPTQANVPYGTHPRQVLDFYQAPGDQPTPVIFNIHGGGWMSGDKAPVGFVEYSLKAGISVVSINYRLIPQAKEMGVVPPVKACLEDAVRALQFVRHHATQWNLDKTRIVGCGGSAGGFSTLYLALSPDMAVRNAPDEVARESTRLQGALLFVPQTSLDPQQMRAWMPDITYGPHAFGLHNFDEFLKQRAQLLPEIAKISPYLLVSSDDPPLYLSYDSPVQMGQPSKDPTHSANFGEGLAQALRNAGVEFEFHYTGGPATKHADGFAFLKDKLGVK